MMATKYLTVDREISPLKIFVGAMEQRKLKTQKLYALHCSRTSEQ